VRGKEIRESTKTDDPEKAAKYLKRRVREVENDRDGIKQFVGPKADRIKVSELLDALKSDYELRGKWSDRIDSMVKRVRAHFGDWKAAEVSSEAVASWQLELRDEEYRDATINRFCQILGQSFNLAIERKHLASGPVVKRLSEVGNERKGFFTEAEIRSVIRHLPEYLKDFVLFAYITGMRRGEVQSLRWSDVHGDVITLRPENSKNSESRTIPLDGELDEVIERRRTARKVEAKDGSLRLAEHIFHLKGQPIASFRVAWATACKFAGVEGRLFHDLRRCAARNLLASGVPQAVAMKITGHKTDSMFRRYAIVTVEQQREALRATKAYREQQAAVEREKLATMLQASTGIQ
jgi:integrase